MSDSRHFALILLLAALAGLAAVLANRVTERLRVPTPVLVLIGAAVAVELVPALHSPPEQAVERVLTIALVCILFDGGLGIGVPRARSALGVIGSVGVLGTFLTAAGAALLLHLAFGLDWYAALLVGTALAPTDPAVVFSVLGSREIEGRSGTVLEGESGANDPVGIALMAALLSAGHVSAGAFGHVAVEFVLQMALGLAIGLVGGRLLLEFMRRVALPAAGLYPLRTLTCALVLYGVATLAHGSGFLAVFVAGIVIGDERAPFKTDIARFHGALAGLGEIVAFVVLGLTVDLHVLARADVWVPGLVLGVALALVLRPVLVAPTLLPARLRRNENAFVLLAGLKGAVALLLGESIIAQHVPDAERLYGIIAAVVIFSVAVQGSLVGPLAGALRLPMRPVEPTER